MDDLTFSARRASTAAPARSEPADLETRFRSLVQSPLRAGILRYLSARPEESFDVESLMQTFGRLKLAARRAATDANGRTGLQLDEFTHPRSEVCYALGTTRGVVPVWAI